MSLEAKIQSYLQPSTREYFNHWHCYETIHSTNTYLSEQLPDLLDGTVCLAQEQTAGKGRQGKSWISNKNTGIFLSTAHAKAHFKAPLEGLSCALGVAAISALAELGVLNLQLKWPNDIYSDNAKLGGILVEVFSTHIIIGIGLNLQPPKGCSHPVASLASTFIDPLAMRPIIIAKLLDHFWQVLTAFFEQGFVPFVEEANRLNLLSSRPFKCEIHNQLVQAQSAAISLDGSLSLQTPDNQTLVCYSGEVSLHL